MTKDNEKEICSKRGHGTMNWLVLLAGPLAGGIVWGVSKLLPYSGTTQIVPAIYNAAIMQITVLGILMGVVIALQLQ